ncbi:integral membrane family protein [Apiospora saccharicola]|uniref:Integral membrane family protein n=1 Tax=Apiospora saccharicola TaxID=335842 RepID=A0ABR1UDS2_9PEZI
MSATAPPPLPGAGLPDDYRGSEILGAVIATTSVALITVLARLWVRLTMVHKMGSDVSLTYLPSFDFIVERINQDWAMIIAMTLSLAGLGVVIPQVYYGAGRHIVYLAPDVATMGLKINFVSQAVYLWAIPAVKMSIGLFLLRIAPNKIYRRMLQGVMVFTMVYTMFCFLTLLLQCTNLAILWDPTVQATCWSKGTLQMLSHVNSIINIVTDMFFAVLPAPMLWNVQINMRTKASLICIMGLGVFAVAAALIKSLFLSNYGKTGDFLWDSTDLTIWISAECNTGIIAACLPCLKPLFKRILDSTTQRYGKSSFGSSANQTNQSYKMKSYSSKGKGGGSRHFQAQNQPKIGRGSRAMSKGNSNEDELALTKPASPNAITKVTTVTIDTSHPIDSSWWSPTSPRMRV